MTGHVTSEARAFLRQGSRAGGAIEALWVAACVLGVLGVLAGREAIAGPDRAGGGNRRFFVITVVDSVTGRGVPLVELRTVSGVRHYTDSNGVVAFHEPGLMSQRVFFHVKSHGYEFPADGFGNRGVGLSVRPGGSARIKVRRVNIAERLYRITGGGIYRDSILAGLPVPLRRPLLNGRVVGQDTVQMTEYRGKLYWLWGDTNKPSYPLGHFGTAGATSLKPGEGGLDPAVGVDLTYFVGESGFSRPMCAVPGPGMKWMSGLVVVPDGTGAGRLVARYTRMKALGKMYDWGFAVFDDGRKVFEPLVRFDADELIFPCSHALRCRSGEAGDRREYVYFTSPYPLVRVRADLESIKDPHRYEAFTCLARGTRYAKAATRLDRDPGGRLRWAWKADTDPVGDGRRDELVAAGKMRLEEAWNLFTDPESGKPIRAHTGSVAFNEHRRRWVMIFCQAFGRSSYLGEIWYAEAEALEGPWRTARKIVTHDRYSFYNVKHHPVFDQQGGRLIYFEGTYTAMFSGNADKTPRYDYNQIMYRLDLAEPRLKLPPSGGRR